MSERTVHNLIKAGDIPAFRIGGSYRFRESELLAWLEDSRVKPRKKEEKPSTVEVIDHRRKGNNGWGRANVYKPGMSVKDYVPVSGQ